MIIKFNHQNSLYHNDSGQPLTYVTAIRENETHREMFETGWVPYDGYWYQTRSARLRLSPLLERRKRLLKKVTIEVCGTIPELEEMPDQKDVDAYSTGQHFDFIIDGRQWGRLNYYNDCVLFTLMNRTRSEKSYGKLAYYYLIDKLANAYDYLYITDYYLPQFGYKASLPGFEYWSGSSWVLGTVTKPESLVLSRP